MLDKLLESMAQRHIDKPVSPEAYQRWRNNGVTRRLMEEFELDMAVMLSEDAQMSDINTIGLQAVAKQYTKEAYEKMLNWKPQELLIDED